MYRLRTVDKGKPLIISDAVIQEYSDCNVDTLHKKNLLSLGEDTSHICRTSLSQMRTLRPQLLKHGAFSCPREEDGLTLLSIIWLS
jgi:hypothetical protein